MKLKALLAVGLFAATSLPAQAAVITQSVFFSTADAFEATSENILMGPFGLFDVRFRAWGGGVLTPFTLSDGDILETTVTFDAPLEISDPLGGQPESFFLSIGNGIGPVGGFDADRSHALTGLAGAVGDDTGDPIVFASTLTLEGENANQIVFGNLTNSSLFITGFTLSTTFVSIDPQGAPFTSVSLFIVDEAVPVPVPGALALLSVGLIGLRLKRRTA